MEEVDLVLVMTVDPGYGGQRLIPRCLDKVRRVAAARAQADAGFLIEVDGGITRDTAAAALGAGADVLVVGSAFFGADGEAARSNLITRLRTAREPAAAVDRP